MTLRIAYPMRVDALAKPGGDVEHMRLFIGHCEREAARLGFVFAGTILTELAPGLADYDAVHLSNLDRPVDLLAQFRASRHAGRPAVLTPLHHSYREIGRYERGARGGLVGKVSGLLGFYPLEALRILVKSRTYRELRPALVAAMKSGLRAGQREVLAGVDRVLLTARKEGEDIAAEVAELPAAQVDLFRHSLELDPAAAVPVPQDIDVLVVARVESRKNQLAILDTVERLGLRATFVGRPNPNHRAYVQRFEQRLRRSGSTWIPGVPREEVAALFRRARVHVSASWFEVASLVDLEAYAAGCRVVASRCGGTAEVLAGDAHYVDPGAPAEIAQSISAALAESRAGVRNRLADFAAQSETGPAQARRLLALYAELAGRADVLTCLAAAGQPVA